LRYREKDRKKGEVDGTVSSGDLLTSNCDTIIPIHSEQRYKFKLNVKETVIRELKSQIHNKKKYNSRGAGINNSRRPIRIIKSTL
jgi:hypothetical protein